MGIAYGAGIGGVRMLDGDVTDAIEARSLQLNNQHIQIYSARYVIALSPLYAYVSSGSQLRRQFHMPPAA